MKEYLLASFNAQYFISILYALCGKKIIMATFKLSVFTDEITQDFGRAGVEVQPAR